MARLLRAWAPVIFVVLWSTGFIVARYSTHDAGPLTFMCTRMIIGAALLSAIAAGSRAPRLERTALRWSMLTGVLMHAVYLGGVYVAIDHGLPSGVSALIVGLQPVLTSIVAARWLGEVMSPRQWLGVGLGLGGVVAVVVDRLAAGAHGVALGPILACVLAMLGISAGTLLQRRHGATIPVLWGTAAQCAAAAVVLAVPAVFVEHVDLRVTTDTVFAMIWSVLVLTLLSVCLLMWLLQRQAASTVSSLFFLVPALSTVEGAILFGERLGPLAIVGLVVALVGVALVLRPRRVQV